MISSFLINLILLGFFGRHDFQAVASYEGPILTLKAEAKPLIIGADKGVVIAADGRLFLYGKKADETQPIASITKLMTALVFLDNNPGWETTYKIQEVDKIEGGHLNLFLGEEVRLKDIFYTSLVASDNGATSALVNATGLSQREFVDKMNIKARELGLDQTKFVDPIGLSDNNISTAYEVALLAKTALNNLDIRTATDKKDYTFSTLDGRTKAIESTDYLLFEEAAGNFQVMGGKTGFTDRAGYCFVGLFKGPDGRELISVVLNSSGKNERFKESKALINWVFANYTQEK